MLDASPDCGLDAIQLFRCATQRMIARAFSCIRLSKPARQKNSPKHSPEYAESAQTQSCPFSGSNKLASIWLSWGLVGVATYLRMKPWSTSMQKLFCSHSSCPHSS
jgi:hypothetical protein